MVNKEKSITENSYTKSNKPTNVFKILQSLSDNSITGSNQNAWQ